jgi:hypothetical protein
MLKIVKKILRICKLNENTAGHTRGKGILTFTE